MACSGAGGSLAGFLDAIKASVGAGGHAPFDVRADLRGADGRSVGEVVFQAVLLLRPIDLAQIVYTSVPR